MDPNIIYVKTTSGEEAIQQRTRVIQRNVRMVLILVDGQSSVADLCRKTGNPQLTENALTELEKGGFIELKLEQHDSLWEESKRVAQEIRSAAIEKTFLLSTAEKKEKYPDFQHSMPLALTVPEIKNQPSDMPISMHSVFDARDVEDFSLSQFSIAPPDSIGARNNARLSEKAVIKKELQMSAKSGKMAQVSKPSVIAQLKSLWASAERDLDEEKKAPKPIRRYSTNRRAWPLIALLGLVGVFGLGFLTILFFPFHLYLTQVEAAFTRSIGRPVTVGAMRVDFSPVAGLLLTDVRTTLEKKDFLIEEIRLQPDLSTLLSSRIIFRKAVIRGLELPLESIGGMPGVFASFAKEENPVGVEQVFLEKTDVSLGALLLKNLEADIRLDSKGLMQSLYMRTSDRVLAVVATPDGSGVGLVVEAYSWRPFEDSKLVFDSANFNAKFDNGNLALNDIEIRLLDGVVKGSAAISSNAEANISGEVRFERINTNRVGDMLGLGKRFSGEVAGKIRFSATTGAWDSVLSSTFAEGDFLIQRGSLSGIDLAEAIRRVSGTPVQGGVTSFEQLSGRMKITPEKSQFSALVMNSGLMQSTGYFDVSKNRKLSGKLELQMKGSVNKTRVPVFIDGTLDSPVVQAKRG